jgi:hypothetical protein
MATVPSGIRSMATRKATAMVAAATPRASIGTTAVRGMSLRRGRTSTARITPPATSRSQAVPTGPTVGNSPAARALPSCTQSMATSASDQAGARSVMLDTRSVCLVAMRWLRAA